MKKIVWNKVTWYSWWGAVLFFLLILPSLTFYIGRYYEGTLTLIAQADSTSSYLSSYLPQKRVKTHRNYAGGYEFKYPTEWTVTGYAPTDDGMDVQIESLNKLYNTGIYTLRNMTESLDYFLDQRDEQRNIKTLSLVKIQVNGYPAYQRLEANGPTQYYSTYIMNGDTLYILRMEGSIDRPFSSRQQTAYQEIIASFKPI